MAVINEGLPADDRGRARTQIWDSPGRILDKPEYPISISKWESISASETELNQAHDLDKILGDS